MNYVVSLCRNRCISGQIRHLVDYQLEDDEGKLTTVGNLEKLMLQVLALCWSKIS